MNERINQLAEQAFNFVAEQNMTKKEFFWENIRHDRTLQYRVDEKFAELIVQECMSLVSEPGPDMNDTERGILAQIKEHFGVEE